MTELDIQKKLFDAFLTLDTFASSQGYTGEAFLEIDESKTGYEQYVNVHFPNVPFDYPDDKRWFDLDFASGEPSDVALMQGSQSRFAGVFYIDIIVPQDVAELEVETKYKWIAKLFHNVNIDVVDIMQVYISTKGNDADHYRLQVAVSWEADINKE